jgi:uncharacterized protein (TIGR03437 family)
MRMQFYFPALALAVVCSAFAQSQYIISTIAGNNTSGYSGDGGAATSAQLNQPTAVVVDSSGNIYIADAGNHRVRKISNGTISTFAGNGTAGYMGDGAAASAAELNNPVGLGLDFSGNLFIADAANSVIREVSLSSGKITTFAGENSLGAGYTGDAAAATLAQLNDPTDVCIDTFGNVYIADANNNVIREVSSGNINTLVGGAITFGQLHFPDAVVVDKHGNLFIADTVGRRVVEFSNGTFTVVAGNESYGFSGDGGLATQASLFDPMGVAVDPAGNVYIADTLNSRIRMVSTNGTISTIAGTGFPGYLGDGGPATQAWLYFPRRLSLDSAGNIYIADSANNVIRMLTPVATPTGNAVVNAASYSPQISPGSLASLFGTHLGASLVTAGVTAGALPMSLSGVSIAVNGRPAPILAVTSTQVNFQVPWETSPGSAEIVVSVNGFAGSALSVPVQAAAPGLFIDSTGRAIAENSDYSVNTASNPAQAGSTITAYLTGSGPVNLSVSDGVEASANPVASAMSQTSASIGPLPAQVMFTGLAPGFVGLSQMNIVVPSGLASGDYPLTVTIAGKTSNAGTLSIK